MNFSTEFNPNNKRPFIIAGPCSAESEEQVVNTAKELVKQDINLFRAGIWKPRTRPGSFQGVGSIGLKWLQTAQKETGLKVTTEVANRDHVFECLKYGIDAVWIGARSSVSPFVVQEIADALEGADIPVFIKNPINPDLNLWIGAIERIYKAGITQIGVIHRGFSFHGKTQFRNIPRWQLPIELKRQFPDLTMICDNSHICGRRDLLQEVAQKAMDLNFDGLMTEIHPNPDSALSDAQQQITPEQFKNLLGKLVYRSSTITDPKSIGALRSQIDEIDDDLLNLLGKRMELADAIGEYKKSNDIAILQTKRWSDILEKGIKKGDKLGLSEEFISKFLKAIHQESINHQTNVMNK